MLVISLWGIFLNHWLIGDSVGANWIGFFCVWTWVFVLINCTYIWGMSNFRTNATPRKQNLFVCSDENSFHLCNSWTPLFLCTYIYIYHILHWYTPNVWTSLHLDGPASQGIPPNQAEDWSQESGHPLPEEAASERAWARRASFVLIWFQGQNMARTGLHVCVCIYIYGGFLKWGYPKMVGVYWKIPLKRDDLGVPPF